MNDGSDQPATRALQVSRNDNGSRYEGRLDGELVTVIEFRRQGDVFVFSRTTTEPRWRRRGLAAETTRQALEDVRRQGRRMQPVCAFTVAYLEQHPEVADLRG